MSNFLVSLSSRQLKTYSYRFWLFFLFSLCFVFLLIITVSIGAFGPLPSFQDLENPTSNHASEVISADGTVIGSYYLENRSFVPFSDISPYLIDALIATEDIRFYQHSGIDFSRTASILLYNLVGKRQGASTITQQLALNLFSKKRSRHLLKRAVQKLKEWVIAVRLERNYTKNEILAMYLNTVSFGGNSYGIKTAARTFFNVMPAALSIPQAALLVGMLKGTSLYSPVRNPARSLVRRNTVLSQMRKANVINEQDYVFGKAAPLGLNYQSASHNEGIASYFREVLRLEVAKLLVSGSAKWKDKDQPYDLYRDGLKIYTTIHKSLQIYAEQAVSENLSDLQPVFNRHWKALKKEPWAAVPQIIAQAIKNSDRYYRLKQAGLSEDSIAAAFNRKEPMEVFTHAGTVDTLLSPLDSIKYYKMFLRSAMLSMNPRNGYIRAWVGGPDYRYFKYDQVKQGKRQVGSTFKPFVYATAIDNGFSPCQEIPNEPVSFEGYPDYHPKNAGGTSGGYLTLTEALARSVNLVTLNLTYQLGPKSIVEMARRLGIPGHLPQVPSIGLGVADISLYDMLGAYATFADKGIWKKPVYLLRIENQNGNIIYQNQPEVKQAISEQTAYIMLHMMKANSTIRGGTALRLRWNRPKYNMKYPIASKTGTTNDQSDGWFIGITPDLVTGVWTGGEDRVIRFNNLRLGGGTQTALPAWSIYMNKVYKDEQYKISTGDFVPPPNLNIELDCTQYYSAPTDVPGDGGTNSPEEDKKLGF